MTTETTIALGKLVPGKANVRRTKAGAGVAELAASIAAHGLIQNLVVRKAPKGDKYEVVAGGRRLAALTMLLKDGGSIGGQQVTKTYPVRVLVSEADSDTELSLAENTQRVAMHVVDEVLAYRQLLADGMAEEDIAARFGQSVVTVRQRLKLASLSPRVLEAMREDGVSLEQAKALAVSDNHAAQEAAWFDQSQWHRSPNHIRAMLTSGHARLTDRLARFVGLEAYEAAGGAVLRDLFGEDEGTYLTDGDLLSRLAMERLAPVANQVLEEGWRWVETSLEPTHIAIGNLGRVYPERREPTEAEAAELASLTRQYNDIVDALEDDEDEERLAVLDAQETAIHDRAKVYTPETLAVAGCVVGIDHEGRVSVTRGLIKPEDQKAARAAGKSRSEHGGEGEKATARGMSSALIGELTAIRTAALRVELSNRPEVALRALLMPLVSGLFHGYRAVHAQPVEIRGDRKTLEQLIKEPETCKPLNAWQEMLTAWGERLPGDPEALWDWLAHQDMSILLELLALVTAANLNAVGTGPQAKGLAGDIAEAVGLDMGSWWTPRQAFLSRIAKADIAAAMAEAGCSTESVATLERFPKAEAVALAEREMDGKGWLPSVFRMPLAA